MDDWTILIRNAIAVLVILMAIAIVTFLAYLGLNSANRGGEQMAETVAAFDARAYETYDQTIVSGTTALAAVKNFKNRSATILVRTIANANAVENNLNMYCASIAGAEPAAAGTTIARTTFTGTAGAVVVGGNDAATIAAHTVPGYKITWSLFPLKQNTATGPATNKSSSSYINPTAKFRSVLIYNANDQPIGILLEQVGIPVAKNPLL